MSMTPPVVRRITLLGPAFVAAVAYVDPGNVATNVTAGARFGYTLVWVVVLAVALWRDTRSIHLTDHAAIAA